MSSILEDGEGVGVRDGGGEGGEVVGVEGAGGRAGGAVDGGVGGAARARLAVEETEVCGGKWWRPFVHTHTHKTRHNLSRVTVPCSVLSRIC